MYIHGQAQPAARLVCKGLLSDVPPGGKANILYQFRTFVYFESMKTYPLSLAAVVILSAWQGLVGWLERNMLTCPSRKYLHLECPGCGLQRSIIALLKGDIQTSLQLYPATIPLLTLLLFTGLHLKYDFLNGALVIKYLQAGVAIIILVFYIYKIVNHKLIV